MAQPSIPKLAASILLLFAVGTPIVAYIWETLNHLLTGHVEPLRLLITLPVCGLFYLLLKGTGRLLSQAERTQSQH